MAKMLPKLIIFGDWVPAGKKFYRDFEGPELLAQMDIVELFYMK